ncbi:MAG: hypothetical protein MI922_21190 [Bacteroidales bacterium]|nr:hypothetical protein [Bacteroidales bacterium]
MRFVPIAIDEYIEKHLQNNPTEDAEGLRARLNDALKDYQDGIKCTCGSDIWVIGSAFMGRSCFTCITGETEPSGDYEIESAILKKRSNETRRHVDDMDPTKICGIFDDDGYEINPDHIKKPSLCITCIHDGELHEEVLCNLTRHGQQNEEEFICHKYKRIN